MKEENKTLTTPEGYTITFRERESVEISLKYFKRYIETFGRNC